MILGQYTSKLCFNTFFIEFVHGVNVFASFLCGTLCTRTLSISVSTSLSISLAIRRVSLSSLGVRGCSWVVVRFSQDFLRLSLVFDHVFDQIFDQVFDQVFD